MFWPQRRSKQRPTASGFRPWTTLCVCVEEGGGRGGFSAHTGRSRGLAQVVHGHRIEARRSMVSGNGGLACGLCVRGRPPPHTHTPLPPTPHTHRWSIVERQTKMVWTMQRATSSSTAYNAAHHPHTNSERTAAPPFTESRTAIIVDSLMQSARRSQNLALPSQIRSRCARFNQFL